MNNGDNTFFVSPKTPDAEGDVGPNYYVQWVNLQFAVWNKTSGERVYGPVNGNTLWSGFGGPCETYNWGDPQVTYDRIANRWVFMQYAFPTNFTEPIAPFYLCMAVSKTDDPTGSYYRYAYHVNVSTNSFPDYPKLGVWPDGYYVTTNNFSNHVPQGAAVYAFDRSKMLKGDPNASFIEYQQSSAYTYLLPADFTGSRLPPAGSPEYFGAMEPVRCLGIRCSSMVGSQLRLWRFHPDFAVPANSSFSGPERLFVNSYGSLCMMSGCIPQPGTENKVDAGSDHLMQRLVYRNFGDHASLVTTHTVDPGNGVAGMRWYELQVTPPNAAEVSVTKQSTYAPADGINRWMGSAAMDGAGNIALGYSMSNGSNVYPSVGYTGATAGSETMNLGETTLVHGGGSETGTDRWGDYSAMSIDPIDEQTFWYTQGYYATTSGLGWTTRIGSFRLAQTGNATLTGVNGALAVFPYVTAQDVSSLGGGCTRGQGPVSWSVSGPISDSGTSPCSGTTGTWTATTTAPLSEDGEYALSATQGGSGGQSQELKIDKTVPSTPELTALPARIKNGQSLTANGVGDNAGGSGVKQVNYLYCQGEGCTPNVLIGSSSTEVGNYAVAWTAQPADGTYEVMAQTEDEAGNTANSPIKSTVIDNTRPAISLTEVNEAPVTFPYATTQNVTSIGGSCGTDSADLPNVSWTVTGAANASGSSSCAGGAWSATVSLEEGTYTLSATQKDEAGNVGTSGNRSLAIDRTAPNPPTLTALPAYIRNGQSLTASGVSDNAGGSGVKQVNYLYCQGEGCTPSTAVGSSSTAAGSYAVVWTGQPADGTYRVMAQTEDKVGQTADSAIQSTVIDNTAPSVSVTELNGSVLSFPYVTNRTVTSVGGVCGTASGDAASVNWSVGGTASQAGSAPCSSGRWTASLTTALSESGAYTLSATQKDAAGNTGASASQVLTLKDLPPSAAFGFLPASPMVGQALSFDGRPSSDPDGTISAYAWTFGDGAAAAGPTPSHAYAKRGTFTVQLSVTDNSGSVGVTAKSLSVSAASGGRGPVVRLKIPSQRLGRVARRGLDVDVSSSEAATAKLRFILPSAVAKALRLGDGSRPVVIATESRRLPAHKPELVRLTVYRRAGHDLLSAKTIVARLTAVVTDTAGKTSATRGLVLHR